MKSLKIKKGDRVKVIAGNDKGAIGEVLSVDPARERVVVEGVNIRKHHRRDKLPVVALTHQRWPRGSWVNGANPQEPPPPASGQTCRSAISRTGNEP